jgi:hypothetical protein
MWGAPASRFTSPREHGDIAGLRDEVNQFMSRGTCDGAV